MNCPDCKEKRCIDTTCRACFPKEDKPVRELTTDKANEHLKKGFVEVFEKYKNYPLDDKGLFHEPETREMQIREHHREEGEVENI